MWLYLIAFFLIAIGAIGGVLTGGIFTIVLLPLGFIALVVALVTGGIGRLNLGRGPTADPHAPLPHSPAAAGGAGTSPERLADARRAQQ